MRECSWRDANAAVNPRTVGVGAEWPLLMSPGLAPSRLRASQAPGAEHISRSNPWRPSSSSSCPHKTGSTFPSRSPRKKKEEREGGREREAKNLSSLINEASQPGEHVWDRRPPARGEPAARASDTEEERWGERGGTQARLFILSC